MARGATESNNSTNPVLTGPLQDKNGVVAEGSSKKPLGKKLLACIPMRLNPKKITEAIEKDDVAKLEKIIKDHPSATDYVYETGKTLLHQCVDNCSKYGRNSTVALDLIRRGCSLEAKDDDGKTVIEDAYEQGQHILLCEMIKTFKAQEIRKGYRHPVKSNMKVTKDSAAAEDKSNRTIIDNIQFHLFSKKENKWILRGNGCRAHISTTNNTRLHVVDAVQEVHLSTSLNAIKQIVIRKRTKKVEGGDTTTYKYIVMEVEADSETEGEYKRQCYSAIFETEYDLYHFCSIYGRIDQEKMRVVD